ncbi:MAG: TVP38/TMEM64 family protein [Opitutales bacterium]|nr:TVP38/TMEM64 family protein [Opitutales bacterium]
MNAGPSEEPSPPGPAETHSAVWIRGLALIAGIVVLIVLARTLPVGNWMADFNQFVAGLGPAGIVVFIAVFAVAMVLFVPGTFFALGAGFAFGPGWGMAAAVSGATLGATAAFLIARYAARDWVRGWSRERRKLKALDRAVARRGWRVVALLRLSPVFPFPVLNYVLGLTSVRLVSYVAATAVGILPGTFLYVAVGYAGRTGLEPSPGPGDHLRLAILAAVLLLTLGITVYLTAYARRVLRAEERWEAEQSGDG